MKQIVLNKVFYQRLSLLFLTILFTTSTAWADASGYCGDPDVNDGHNVSWTYVESTHTLTISGAGAMADFTPANAPWQEYCENDITKIVISDGITTIGYAAFGGCYQLTDVNIPNTVTSIGAYGFCDCI